MGLLNVIEYRGNHDGSWVVYRHPNFEFNNNSKLIVSIGQVAILVHGGKVESILENGTHVLKNLNLPVLSTMQKSNHSGGVPFPMQVYFINKSVKLNMLWGTMDSILLLEPKFNVRVNVRARGQFGLRISNYQFLLTQLIGSIDQNLITFEIVNSFFRGLINTKIKTILSSEIIKNKISLLDVNMHLEEISSRTLSVLKPEFEFYGFELINFYYSSINLPAEDLDVINKILNKNAEFDILGADRYKASRGYDVLESAAKNEASGNMASAGLGIGIGTGFAKDLMIVNNELNLNETKCIKCDHVIPKNSKFCPNCGSEQVKKCAKCHQELKKDAKFCSSCGTAVNEVPSNEK